MEHKSKNKKLIILVAVLIVGIGASLAYFVSQVILNGSGSETIGTTATINNSKLTVVGNLEFNDTNIYPGHQTISSIKVIATGDNELIPYNLIWTGTNTLNTPLNYTVYKTSTQIDTSATCEKTKDLINGAYMLYETCDIKNIDSLGTAISSGTINKSETETKVIIAEEEFITSTNDGITYYYYIILEYPNLETEQNSDIGGSFTGTVSVEASNAEPDINIVAVYIEQEDGTYQESTDIPQSGYTIDTEKSVCSNGATPSGITPNITINNLSKSGTSCYLYFKELCGGTCLNILVNNAVTTRSDFSSVYTTNTAGKIFSATDDDGTTYYFAGDSPSNWVKFAGFYWRIIRINGDGTIRMIYNGTGTNTTGEGAQISTSAYNSSYSNNMYVGYKYTSGSVHGTGTNSTIKSAVDSWYSSNLSSYASYIDTNAGFCNDRYPSTSNSSSNGSGGTSTTETYYAPYIRLTANKQPSFKCQTNSDLFTISDASKGNKALSYPVGLITADEVAYAGGVVGSSNSSYWLYTNQTYWTMSPDYYNSSFNTRVFIVNSDGKLANDRVSIVYGIRPVINLRSDTVFSSGDGTSSNPYIVKTS